MHIRIPVRAHLPTSLVTATPGLLAESGLYAGLTQLSLWLEALDKRALAFGMTPIGEIASVATSAKLPSNGHWKLASLGLASARRRLI